jgi:TolA-binding protein
MARTAQVPSLSPRQALYILEKLIDERKVTADDVRRHLAGMWQEMSVLEKRIEELRGFTQPIAHPVRAARKTREKVKRAVKRLSAERRASQQLQGQYLGYMRQIPETQRERYKKIATTEGRERAVAAMKIALGK